MAVVATDIVGNPHIQLEVAVLLAVEAHNSNSSQAVLILHQLAPMPHQLPPALSS